MKNCFKSYTLKVIILIAVLILSSQPSYAFFKKTYNPNSPKIKEMIELIKSGDKNTLSVELAKRSNQLSKTEQLHFLYKAVVKKNCQDEIVQMLVDTNTKIISNVAPKVSGITFPMSMKLILKKSVAKNCVNEVKILFQIANESDVIAVIQDPPERYMDEPSLIERIKRDADRNHNIDHLADMLNLFDEYFEDKKKLGLSDELELVMKKLIDVLQTTLDLIEKRAEAAKINNSPDRIKGRALNVIKKIKRQQTYIDHQKRIAELSGVVDTSVLYEAADNIIFYEKQLDGLKKEYKNATGVDLSLPRY